MFKKLYAAIAGVIAGLMLVTATALPAQAYTSYNQYNWFGSGGCWLVQIRIYNSWERFWYGYGAYGTFPQVRVNDSYCGRYRS